MKGPVKLALAANLAVLAILAFAYPQLMVAPGKLISGHRALESDCFACHTAFGGTAAERCTTCHQPDQIGRLTTAGQPIAKPLTSTPFHQKLVKRDCLACHSDHAGVKRYRQVGRFDHSLLGPVSGQVCQDCHKPPADTLHQQITGNCLQCHSQVRWTPATFEHDRFFRFDRDHAVQCTTCHTRNDYKRYTCYGCHEHTPERIRGEHIEEGIRDFRNCHECHRSADENGIRGGDRGGEGLGDD